MHIALVDWALWGLGAGMFVLGAIIWPRKDHPHDPRLRDPGIKAGAGYMGIGLSAIIAGGFLANVYLGVEICFGVFCLSLLTLYALFLLRLPRAEAVEVLASVVFALVTVVALFILGYILYMRSEHRLNSFFSICIIVMLLWALVPQRQSG